MTLIDSLVGWLVGWMAGWLMLHKETRFKFSRYIFIFKADKTHQQNWLAGSLAGLVGWAVWAGWLSVAVAWLGWLIGSGWLAGWLWLARCGWAGWAGWADWAGRAARLRISFSTKFSRGAAVAVMAGLQLKAILFKEIK